MVEALLTAGADVHALEEVSRSTPLHWAAEGGHLAIVELLLARGASLEARDDWHRLTPLGWSTVVDWAPQYREDRVGTVTRASLRPARPSTPSPRSRSGGTPNFGRSPPVMSRPWLNGSGMSPGR